MCPCGRRVTLGKLRGFFMQKNSEAYLDPNKMNLRERTKKKKRRCDHNSDRFLN